MGVKATTPPLFFECLTYMSRSPLGCIPNRGAALPFWVSIRQRCLNTDKAPGVGLVGQGHSAFFYTSPPWTTRRGRWSHDLLHVYDGCIRAGGGQRLHERLFGWTRQSFIYIIVRLVREERRSSCLRSVPHDRADTTTVRMGERGT